MPGYLDDLQTQGEAPGVNRHGCRRAGGFWWRGADHLRQKAVLGLGQRNAHSASASSVGGTLLSLS